MWQHIADLLSRNVSIVVPPWSPLGRQARVRVSMAPKYIVRALKVAVLLGELVLQSLAAIPEACRQCGSNQIRLYFAGEPSKCGVTWTCPLGHDHEVCNEDVRDLVPHCDHCKERLSPTRSDCSAYTTKHRHTTCPTNGECPTCGQPSHVCKAVLRAHGHETCKP